MMPFYGQKDQFIEAVQSVLAQTDVNWRLTVIDDKYPDTSPGEWFKSLSDSRLTYIRNDTNLLPSRNYNKSVGLATAEFVVIMGCDDVLLPNFVEYLRGLISGSQDDVVLIQPGVAVIDENGQHCTPMADRIKRRIMPAVEQQTRLHGEPLATSLLRGNWTYFPSLAWRTSELQKRTFREDLNVVQDLAMIMDLVLAGGVMVVDSEVCFLYRRHRHSFSGTTGPDGSKFRQERQLFSELAQRTADRGWPQASTEARRHVLSRLNAATELPFALASGNWAGMRNLSKHIFG